MSIFKEIPPTAGFSFSFRDIFSLSKIIKYHNTFENDFKDYLGSSYTNITYSGTAALYLILESLKELSTKKTVIIPSYVCPLVPLAIKRAALKVEVCDIDKDSFDFDYKELDSLCACSNDILAVVSVHLAGIPINFDNVARIAKQRGIFIIEDCAQALGAEYLPARPAGRPAGRQGKGKKVGTLGDFSFFSLCRGKGLTIYEGGVAVANNARYTKFLEDKINALEKNDVFSESFKVLELFGYWLFYNPYLFWFVFRMPQAFWSLRGRNLKAYAEEYTLDFPMHRVSRLRKILGQMSFYRLDKEVASQREKAEYYIRELSNQQGLRLIKEPDNAKATYPYLVLLFDDIKRREKVLKLLVGRGFGASIVYISPITDYDYLKDIVGHKKCPAATNISQRQITLSTNSFLKEKDLAAIIDIIKNTY
ncbi:MAG: DegT/DnrJ/EryC1/StrS family aminotransferase [Candidatus Omnitrophota bacterium]|nr:DegT/DnrJ/EryC1/StrS family aminotransferase [Candidatus Omnitrophota bacterium]